MKIPFANASKTVSSKDSVGQGSFAWVPGTFRGFESTVRIYIIV